MSRQRAKSTLAGGQDGIEGIDSETMDSEAIDIDTDDVDTGDIDIHDIARFEGALAVGSRSAQGLRNCLAQLEREAEQNGFALTAHLLAVAGDAVLEEQAAHGCQRPH